MSCNTVGDLGHGSPPVRMIYDDLTEKKRLSPSGEIINQNYIAHSCFAILRAQDIKIFVKTTIFCPTPKKFVQLL